MWAKQCFNGINVGIDHPSNHHFFWWLKPSVDEIPCSWLEIPMFLLDDYINHLEITNPPLFPHPQWLFGPFFAHPSPRRCQRISSSSPRSSEVWLLKQMQTRRSWSPQKSCCHIGLIGHPKPKTCQKPKKNPVLSLEVVIKEPWPRGLRDAEGLRDVASAVQNEQTISAWLKMRTKKIGVLNHQKMGKFVIGISTAFWSKV